MLFCYLSVVIVIIRFNTGTILRTNKAWDMILILSKQRCLHRDWPTFSVVLWLSSSVNQLGTWLSEVCQVVTHESNIYSWAHDSWILIELCDASHYLKATSEDWESSDNVLCKWISEEIMWTYFNKNLDNFNYVKQ